jgi:hypothetical protein
MSPFAVPVAARLQTGSILTLALPLGVLVAVTIWFPDLHDAYVAIHLAGRVHDAARRRLLADRDDDALQPAAANQLQPVMPPSRGITVPVR